VGLRPLQLARTFRTQSLSLSVVRALTPLTSPSHCDVDRSDQLERFVQLF
jgi:hypothetical protein